MNRASLAVRSSESATDHTVTEAVVEAVADAEDVHPIEVSPPLATVIDPDALEAFVESVAVRSTAGRVEFSYSGYAVTVTGDGDVDVEPAD